MDTSTDLISSYTIVMSHDHGTHENYYQSVFTPSAAKRGEGVLQEYTDTPISFDESETSSPQTTPR